VTLLIGVTVFFFVMLATALFAFGAATVAPASVIGARLRALSDAGPGVQKLGLEARLEQSVLDPLSRMLPKSPSTVSRTRAMLMQAGYREFRHLTVYMGVRALLAASGLAVGITLGWLRHAPLMLIALPLAGYMVPRFVLKRMIALRHMRLRLALPDALDLSVICVEAGLGLDQVLQRVGKELKYAHPELSDEFSLVNLEMRAGKARAEALRNLATRTGVDDLRSLVAVLIQTDRFGTSIAQALRVHSDSMRTERRQRAEEAAARTTIKMVPVLVFFIFPAIFVVTLGPAAIQLARFFMPMVQR
jgi:tight adherence protein C